MGNMKLKNGIQFKRFLQLFLLLEAFFTPFDTTNDIVRVQLVLIQTIKYRDSKGKNL